MAVEQRVDKPGPADGWARDRGSARPAFLEQDGVDASTPENEEELDQSVAELASGVHPPATRDGKRRHARAVGEFHAGLRNGTTRIPSLGAGRSAPGLPKPPAKSKPKPFKGPRPGADDAKADAPPAPPGPLDHVVSAMRAEPGLALQALRELREGPSLGRSLDLQEVAKSLPIELLRNLAADSSAPGPAKGPWQPLLDNIWKHTLIAARAAEILAPQALRREPGAIYTLALLHNVGEIAIIELYRTLDQPAPAKGIADGKLESEMSRHHEVIGGVMLRRLRLPGILAAVAEDHHPPMRHVGRTAPARYAPVVLGCSAAASTLGLKYRANYAAAAELTQCAERVGIDESLFLNAVKAAQAEWSPE